MSGMKGYHPLPCTLPDGGPCTCPPELRSELAAPAGSVSVGKQYGTVDELVADTCSPEVMRTYMRLTAPTQALVDALRMRVHQLEMTTLDGGPSEICGAIDEVESALHELRELVTPKAATKAPPS